MFLISADIITLYFKMKREGEKKNQIYFSSWEKKEQRKSKNGPQELNFGSADSRFDVLWCCRDIFFKVGSN